MTDDPFFASSPGRWAERNLFQPASLWRRIAAKTLAIILAIARDVSQGPMTLHASSLVYTTLLSVVPLMALAFAILKGFGAHNQLAPLLKELLAPLGPDAAAITGRVVSFVDNMHVGVLGATGLAVLLYTSISVGRKVEQAFNEIWHVGTSQPLGRSITKFLSIIIAGPILLFSAFGMSASLMSSAFTQDLITIEPLGRLIAFAAAAFPYVIIMAAFTIFYWIVPNAKVRFLSALGGGLAASFVWTLAGWAFATFVASSSSYTAIYSAFASLILLLIWVNVNWLVLLIGCAVAFYVQHPQSLCYSVSGAGDDPWSREHAALSVLQVLGRKHYGAGSATAETLRRETGLPQEVVEATLTRLHKAGILLQSADDSHVWAPARPFDATPVVDVWEAVYGREADAADAASRDPALSAYEERIRQGVAAALGEVTLKELALGPPPIAWSETMPRLPMENKGAAVR